MKTYWISGTDHSYFHTPTGTFSSSALYVGSVSMLRTLLYMGKSSSGVALFGQLSKRPLWYSCPHSRAAELLGSLSRNPSSMTLLFGPIGPPLYLAFYGRICRRDPKTEIYQSVSIHGTQIKSPYTPARYVTDRCISFWKDLVRISVYRRANRPTVHLLVAVSSIISIETCEKSLTMCALIHHRPGITIELNYNHPFPRIYFLREAQLFYEHRWPPSL